jgi:hypothetical protein
MFDKKLIDKTVETQTKGLFLKINSPCRTENI